MRNVIGIFIIILLLLGICIIYLYTKSSQTIPAPQLSPTPAITALYCQVGDLKTQVDLSPGAGNVYGTFTLKNISKQACQIQSDKFITANYDIKRYSNIVIQQKGQPQNGTINLLPDQMLYSQVHYPNGPQCPNGVKQANVTFEYELSGGQKISFKNQDGKTTQSLTVCNAPVEITTIEIWNIATQPITPQ